MSLAGLGISHSKLKNRDAARDYLNQSLNLGLTDDWAAEVHFYRGNHLLRIL